MKNTRRKTGWFFLIGLVCLTLLSCQLTQTVLEEATPTPPPTNTPLPPPSETPTQPPTDTPVPPPTEAPAAAPTTIPSPTVPPSPTVVPPTETPGMTLLRVVNDLRAPINISLNGPAKKYLTVNARSSALFEIPPGAYTYQLDARGYETTSGTIEFPPGPFEWTWGKAANP